MNWPVTPQDLVAIWRRDLGRVGPFSEDASQSLLQADASISPAMATMLRPIAIPLVTSGFAADVLAPRDGGPDRSRLPPDLRVGRGGAGGAACNQRA